VWNCLRRRIRAKDFAATHIMKSLITAGTVFLAVLLVTPALADKGQSSYKQGRDLEARQNYEGAYDAYQHAYDSSPRDTRYRAALTRIRFLAAASKVHRATLLQQAGQLNEALILFEEAARIDPSSSIASQQAINTRNMLQQAHGNHAEIPSHSGHGLSPDILDAQGPVKLNNVSSLPVTLKLSQDTKIVYLTIGQLAGVNVLFDPDLTSRQLNIELNGVTLQEAFDLVAAESKTFWKPMTRNTIFVAADNPAKRKELEENVIKAFYLSNLTAPTELQDLVNTLRSVLDVSRAQQLASQEAIVIRGTPDQVLLAEKIVSDFDQAPAEVVIDFALMEVSRDKVHTLGLSPPTSASVQLQANIGSNSSNINGTSTNGSNSSSSSSGSASSPGNGINLNSLGNLNATDFAATISSANATALLTDSSTKIIQNPQIRSLNGQKASLKIGQRVPTATGSFSSGISGLSVGGLVNTQFQYIDVGVNVDITPHVHPDGDVTLKIALDVSSVINNQPIGGVNEPVIGQRKVEHEIRLKDGEVSLLGGMLQQQDAQSLTGIPGLSQIPILKYLFSQKNTEVMDSEIVFAVIPHIVRRKDFNEFNGRTLDVGTANSIHLRHAPGRVPNLDSANESGIVPAPKPSGEASAALEFDPTAISVAEGTTFTLDVVLSGAQDVYSVPLQIAYDRQALQLVNISNGNFLSQGEQVVALVHREDPSSGAVEITASRPPKSEGASGHGVVTTLTFKAKTTGRFPVKITKAALVHPDQQMTAVSGSDITVSVSALSR
jgi:general secretion pathway protein D